MSKRELIDKLAYLAGDDVAASIWTLPKKAIKRLIATAQRVRDEDMAAIAQELFVS